MGRCFQLQSNLSDSPRWGHVKKQPPWDRSLIKSDYMPLLSPYLSRVQGGGGFNWLVHKFKNGCEQSMILTYDLTGICSVHKKNLHRFVFRRKLCKTLAKRSQHFPTLLGATCCVRLATLLQRVETCWVLKIDLVSVPGCNIRGLWMWVWVWDRIRERLFISSFQVSHYRNTCPFHPMSYPLYLKPTWRARALEMSVVWIFKISPFLRSYQNA